VCNCTDDGEHEGASSLNCESNCDEICLDDLSVCTFNHASEVFDRQGQLIESVRAFQYTRGGVDGQIGWSVNIVDNECQVGHFLSDTEIDFCTCTLTECPDGSMMPKADCSNMGETVTFDFCNPISVVDTGSMFAAFDDTNFDTCNNKIDNDNGTAVPTSVPTAMPSIVITAGPTTTQESGNDQSQNRNTDGDGSGSNPRLTAWSGLIAATMVVYVSMLVGME